MWVSQTWVIQCTEHYAPVAIHTWWCYRRLSAKSDLEWQSFDATKLGAVGFSTNLAGCQLFPCIGHVAAWQCESCRRRRTLEVWCPTANSWLAVEAPENEQSTCRSAICPRRFLKVGKIAQRTQLQVWAGLPDLNRPVVCLGVVNEQVIALESHITRLPIAFRHKWFLLNWVPENHSLD